MNILHRIILLSVCAFSVGFGTYSLAESAPRENISLIHAGTLLARADTAPRTEVSIVIAEGKIRQILPGYVTGKSLGEESIVTLIDLKDKFVLPGLIDSHVHLQMGNTNTKGPSELSDADLTLFGAHSSTLTLEAGFTTVRDLGAPNESIFALRDAIDSGLIPGPRVVAAGSSVSITGGHGESFCDSPSQCKAAVREQIRLGADVIKIAATAGGDGHFDDLPEMEEPEMRAAIDAAHRLNRSVAAHAHSILGIKQAINSGVQSVEHGTFIDEKAAKAMKKNNVFLVPTLTVRDNLLRDIETMPADLQERVRLILDSTPKTIGAAHRIGVKFASGSDAGVVTHGENARELEWLVKIGMTPAEAITAATINAAELLGLKDQVGTIEEGKMADIIAVADDPLEDISALNSVDFVMRSGDIFVDK